ncbi:MAG: efflux RND transporter periplasmic adaptor subunit [Candidatus Nealsonbacteria bacterium]
MKKVIVIVVIVSIVSIFVYQNYFKKTELDFTLVKVVKGEVVQEISETGQVKKGEEVNLGFKLAGVLENIYVEVAEEVKEGEILAKLENSQLRIKLEEAEANLDLAQAQFNKLLAGATQEEIQITQTAVDNARISFESAKQNLQDIKVQGEENLKAAYDDALNALDDSHLKITNALNNVDLIQTTYFTSNDQEKIIVRENKDKIENALNKVKSYLDTAKNTQGYEDIDLAISEMKEALDSVFNALKIIRDTCEETGYKNLVSSTDKTSLDNHQGYINTALTNITNSQQTISSTKLTNSSNINTYQASIDSAQGKLTAAENELTKITADPRKEDVDLYQAQVRQARAQFQLLGKQIEDTILKSPVEGQVVKINKRVGELVQAAIQDPVIILLPASPFKIEVDIYEEDVARMDIGNPVDITLVAFPDETLTGKVISIDPVEKMIEGVVYYEVSISFDNVPKDVKPGMTADLVITTEKKENVLTVAKKAIKTKNGKTIVQVLENNIITEREIKIGLKGTNDLIEVISGLKEGEQVILP